MSEVDNIGNKVDNLRRWERVRRPPADALKTITGGRLRGMTDISPQWRLEAMTAEYGEIGTGWKYTVTNRWTESFEGQVAMFVEIELFTRCGENPSFPASVPMHWSDPIYGIGGAMLISREKDGLRLNDEAPKMAVTDALSVAMKQLGIAADIYMGRWDGSKYRDIGSVQEFITEEQQMELIKLIKGCGADGGKFLAYLGVEALDKLPQSKLAFAKHALNEKRRSAAS